MGQDWRYLVADRFRETERVPYIRAMNAITMVMFRLCEWFLIILAFRYAAQKTHSFWVDEPTYFLMVLWCFYLVTNTLTRLVYVLQRVPTLAVRVLYNVVLVASGAAVVPLNTFINHLVDAINAATH